MEVPEIYTTYTFFDYKNMRCQPNIITFLFNHTHEPESKEE